MTPDLATMREAALAAQDVAYKPTKMYYLTDAQSHLCCVAHPGAILALLSRLEELEAEKKAREDDDSLTIAYLSGYHDGKGTKEKVKGIFARLEKAERVVAKAEKLLEALSHDALDVDSAHREVREHAIDCANELAAELNDLSALDDEEKKENQDV